jgi:excisionase family DNA binding protein
MPDMTMRQAAQWAGVTRATVQKAIVSGRLSATKDELGHYHINPAELERVYQPKQVDGSRDTGKSHPETAELTAARERELALMRELVTKAEERAAELAQDRDHWREQAEAQTRLLTHQHQHQHQHQQQQPASQTPPQEPQTLPAIAPHGIRGRLGRWLLRGR